MSERPTVLIVGAGLGGLSLGLLLERAGIPYMIFERAKSIKPLGMYDDDLSEGVRRFALIPSHKGKKKKLKTPTFFLICVFSFPFH